MARWSGVVARAAVLVALGLPGAAMAQSAIPGEVNNAARAGETLLRQQQEIQEQQQRSRDRAQQAPSGASLLQSPSVSPGGPVPEGQCVMAKRLRLVGARRLKRRQLQELERAVAGHCMGARELDELLRHITDLYVERGYVTTRAYIPPQNAADGDLTVVVIEGKVERVEAHPSGSVDVTTAFPGMRGEVFNLRDAEQGIDQLNRLSSNNARIDIQPGSAPGTSVLAVENSHGRRLSGSLAADDTGSRATGLWQGSATVVADDPLGINDGLLVSFTHNLESPETGPGMSRAISASYSVPWGWWTGDVSYIETAYGSFVPGITRGFTTSGVSRTEMLRLQRVAYRDQRRKLTVYADVTRRDSQNYVEGERINTSSRVLTLLDLSANLSLAQGANLWSFDAGLSHGLALLGAAHDGSAPPGTPRAQFLKWTAGAGLARGFSIGGVRAQVSSTVSAQWSPDALFATEQIAVTGPFAVRGFRDVNLFGDRGALWRNELGLSLSLPSSSRAPISLRPFIGADAGRVWAHGPVPGGYVSSGTVGAGLSVASVHAEISWSESAFRSGDLARDHYLFVRLAASF